MRRQPLSKQVEVMMICHSKPMEANQQLSKYARKQLRLAEEKNFGTDYTKQIEQSQEKAKPRGDMTLEQYKAQKEVLKKAHLAILDQMRGEYEREVALLKAKVSQRAQKYQSDVKAEMERWNGIKHALSNRYMGIND